ncbi:50S ribosomal protein L1 [Pelagibacteraceae bacterium]|jgi:large subunit ribosomal protein L1|uniref:50S ribosomal protein L1 n=1 Tax=Pelagibacter sp. (strain IMCC9063) TaxID=1002672 RepID=UPI000204637C|nr:50S ribosomal protein L1 [Candidatus Pelagibacter sp. IMCC9063]AEA81709.1 LSU ribosomal protein L11p (L12e) [Candidatus Pelagibacter sp. IMCC9063]MDA9168737.1 50S ribosomal protein L1 [Pelagibacteraceae bacterium]|tara:strand:+ start:928 stop:1620 length:693 start_codon:yes stop_codon:yes gene_type:complete
MAEKKKSKRYRSLVKDFDKNNSLKIEEAVKVIKEKSKAKFVESFDVCFSLAVDKTKPDSVLRTTVDLPNGNGKKIKIAVICSNDKVEEAKSAGAEIAGSDDLIETINSGKIDFDVLIAAPDMMSKVGKLGKVLGPKGIMPNPKFGTVSPNVAKAVTDIKNGKVEIRCDKDGNLNLSIGRVNFDDSKIIENFKSVYDVIEKEKPVGLKGNYIKNIFVTNSMGPSVKLNLAN